MAGVTSDSWKIIVGLPSTLSNGIEQYVKGDLKKKLPLRVDLAVFRQCEDICKNVCGTKDHQPMAKERFQDPLAENFPKKIIL